MKDWIGPIVAALLALVVGAGGVLWTVRAVVTSMLKQNKDLIDGALENMKANTAAIEANTRATVVLTSKIEADEKVRAERDRNVAEALRRIESRVTK